MGVIVFAKMRNRQNVHWDGYSSIGWGAPIRQGEIKADRILRKVIFS
jgi:hypothetical protein